MATLLVGARLAEEVTAAAAAAAVVVEVMAEGRVEPVEVLVAVRARRNRRCATQSRYYCDQSAT